MWFTADFLDEIQRICNQTQLAGKSLMSSVQKVWLNAHVAGRCLCAGFTLLMRPQFWLTRRLGCETVRCDTYATWIAQTVVSLQGTAYAAAWDMLTGMLTHGLTPCIYHQKWLRQLTKPMGLLAPNNHTIWHNSYKTNSPMIFLEISILLHSRIGTHANFTIPQRRWSTE